MPNVVILPYAEAQMADVLDRTLDRFGEAKYVEYLQLIDLALCALEQDAEAGKRRPEIHPDAWTLRIARRGRKARHLFLYRIRADVEIGRFLYDGMDFPSHWPKDWHKV